MECWPTDCLSLTYLDHHWFCSQDYIRVVDSLEIPTPDSQYIVDLVAHRHWGDSVLIVDV